MLAFLEIFRFEVRYDLTRPLFWIAGGAFFLITFIAVATDVVQIGGAIGNVNRNAPYVVTQILLTMTVLGVFVTTAFVAGAVLRDHEHGTADLFHSTPVPKWSYLWGRFGGAFAVSLLIFVWVMLGLALGGFMPWLDPERVGPFRLTPYLYAFAVVVVPNVFVMSALFFGVATLTRSMMSTYAGLVALFVGYTVAGVFLSDVENERLAGLIDAFGVGAFEVTTQYWTTAERNARLPALDGVFLENRLLWLAVGVVVLGITFWRYSLSAAPSVGAGTGRSSDRGGERDPRAPEAGDAPAGTAGPSGPGTEAVEAVRAPGVPGAAPTASAAGRAAGTGPALRALLHRTRFEAGRVMRSLPFGILLALGVLNLVAYSIGSDTMFGTPVWPVTYLMLDAIDSSFLLFGIAILTFYSGELIWRERSLGVDGITDSLPVPDWVLWGAKLAALLAISAAVLAVAVVTAVGIQLVRGFTDIEPLVYLKGVGLETGTVFLLLAVLAVGTQVVTKSKYAGFGLMMLYFVSIPALDALHFDHHLYRYAQRPPVVYSDMNGFEPFVEATVWFNLYWGFAALGILVLVHLFWIRGRDLGVRTRLRQARRRLGRGSRLAAGVAALGFLGTGGWIFYNTNVLNEYVPGDVAMDRRAEHERRYGPYEERPQPKIVGVRSEVDLFPGEGAMEARGTYRLRNVDSTPIDSLHVSWNAREVRADEGGLTLSIPGARVVHDDPRLGWRTYELAQPLEPGAGLELEFEVRVRPRGFTNGMPNTDLVPNGSFVHNLAYFPRIGYQDDYELTDPNERRRRDLPPVERMPKLQDTTRHSDHYITSESDWVDYETVVSTSPDQVALAPGELVREWTEDGRRYFHYRTDAPIPGLWAYLSGRWNVRRDRWRDVDISVYHHPDHTYNVDRMIEAVKASLEYFTEAFGPYQHREVRIVEFPRYAGYAQSLPNTIPFSESIGFIARLDDPGDIDYPFYVTAHEVAHQWWAHQVLGANVQGATMTSETMAQYGALMVQEEAYGRNHMRRFLRYELDAYLEGRGGERVEELPLYRVENQAYIHYRKGSLATYALRDYIGEEAFNRAMRRYVADRRFSGPPYTTSAELLGYLGEEVPDEHRGALDDLFRTITLWEWRTTDAVAEPTDDGRWRVRIDWEARKLRADGRGNESEVPLDDRVDVAVFGEEADGAPPEGEVLHLEKRRVQAESGSFEVVVDGRPTRAGIDPFHKLVDRNPANNVAGVEVAGE